MQDAPGQAAVVEETPEGKGTKRDRKALRRSKKQRKEGTYPDPRTDLVRKKIGYSQGEH